MSKQEWCLASQTRLVCSKPLFQMQLETCDADLMPAGADALPLVPAIDLELVNY